ncbi:MAG TPA: hypothetical protein VHO25_14980, partial [Polyangiaceae bacterium]|nr:hypothetical protein [Polyangiaceae bacterium]
MLRKLNSTCLLALAITVSACLPDAEYKHRGPTEPEQLDDGWQTSTPEAEGLNADALAEIHEQLLRED